MRGHEAMRSTKSKDGVFLISGHSLFHFKSGSLNALNILETVLLIPLLFQQFRP